MDAGIYASDPEAPGDQAFVAGRFEHLVPGNRGRLLDVRRTPVAIAGMDEASAMFDVEILAFEDAGARWRLPFEEVGRFQFDRDAARAAPADVARFEAASARLDRPLVVQPAAEALARTRERIVRARPEVARALDAAGLPPRLDPGDALRTRRGDPVVTAAVREVLAARELGELDDAFATSYVSNPGSGELVKGHAIVAAELGLGAYDGRAPRDPGLFTRAGARERRAEHLVLRLAIGTELWARAGADAVTLWRGAAADGALERTSASPLVSMTFSQEVAESHFAGGPDTRTALLLRRRVDPEHLFMTFWETEPMSRQYLEAEAIVVGLEPVRL